MSGAATGHTNVHIVRVAGLFQEASRCRNAVLARPGQDDQANLRKTQIREVKVTTNIFCVQIQKLHRKKSPKIKTKLDCVFFYAPKFKLS
jgi:hypothetical protein